ncbi:hypothetical protein C4K05_3050 [Pseudomonas chlororaphis subsp. aureofaciens]|uniref:Lipoprotein n=1 Tax=Pseudomonas chlororaphis subsp. aureofaciens TaxID=587851 RepID=A0AAD0ZIY9_9PSED|nr:hypothetical protein [Pseudomonas chlororaphis]AZE23446.1 hypothetical protein C4K08_3019 [Pseudomonas chlororaphis subsp. aureofaciens]AZE29742.1 hypothetical protein C4K07_2957 [Pseudomonas chlororaphis subsp. aureofaciens]AZE36046.1 hypothetical protein C4K06_3013 [Pseudomonas chlororaphis subsp. aureofaciens]AZE42390.1 hypothetical protein C4K05_3050 [Pseudomonas chlororaphis subsp. aureofaciens]QHC89555.1 hypothetical protein PchlR47_14910 [Pseudomonas chlororaphis]
MNNLLRGLAVFALMSGASIAAFAAPQASSESTAMLLAQNLPGSINNNPYNSPIRRANPNSMQGTQPSAPAVRGVNPVPVQRPPTLENGGIGNGYPRTITQPRIIDPTPVTPPRNQQQR